MGLIPESWCQAEIVTLWTRFNWRLFRWLTTSDLILPAILSIVFLPLLVRRLPYRKVISAVGMVLLLIYLAAASPGITGLGNQALLQAIASPPTDAQADAIVVLGRGPNLREQRVEVAVELWRQQRAPLIFVSGRGDAPPMVEMLRQRGVPAEAIAGEPCSRTTEENALLTAERLLPQAQRIILVTDAPHLVRSHLTFASLGFEVADYPTALPQTLSRRQRGMLQLREYMGLVSYGLLGRYFPRPLPETDLLQPA